MDRPEDDRGDQDDQRWSLLQAVDLFEVNDDDAQSQELLDDPPDRVEKKQPQLVKGETQVSLEVGVNRESCPDDHEEKRGKDRGAGQVIGAEPPGADDASTLT